MIADSIGSTEKSGSFKRSANRSAIVLLPLPGSPDITMT